jgi:hypothetical protein
MRPKSSIVIVCALVILTASCRSRERDEPGVAKPSVKFSRTRIALGSPVDITYRFEVTANARFDQDYHVMAHFLDGDDSLLSTDDHPPATPTSTWKAGQVIEYTRTVFLPEYQYVGDATFNVGLYSVKDQRRLPLEGENTGQRSYRVASLELLPQTENIFLVYKSGWHPEEVASDVSWRWTKKTAAISFRNPRRDAVLYLHVDNPGTPFNEPQRIDITVNGQAIETFELPGNKEIVHRTALNAAQLGSGDNVEVQVQADKSYVPALLPASKSRDSRELGIRVFHIFVEPRGR